MQWSHIYSSAQDLPLSHLEIGFQQSVSAIVYYHLGIIHPIDDMEMMAKRMNLDYVTTPDQKWDFLL